MEWAGARRERERGRLATAEEEEGEEAATTDSRILSPIHRLSNSLLIHSQPLLHTLLRPSTRTRRSPSPTNMRRLPPNSRQRPSQRTRNPRSSSYETRAWNHGIVVVVYRGEAVLGAGVGLC